MNIAHARSLGQEAAAAGGGGAVAINGSHIALWYSSTWMSLAASLNAVSFIDSCCF